MFDFFKKKQIKEKIEEVVKEEKEAPKKTCVSEDKMIFLSNFDEDGKRELQHNFAQILKNTEETILAQQDKPMDNSNVNFNTLTNERLTRDLYGMYNGFGGNNTLQYLTYLIGQESIVNTAVYDFWLEMLVKNEAIARKVLEFPIQKTFSTINFRINHKKELELDIDNIKQLLEEKFNDIISIIKRSELYGGCYCVITPNNEIRIYERTQLKIKPVNNQGKSMYNKTLYRLNYMLKTRDFDYKWLKENDLDPITFNEFERYPYQNVFLFTGTKKPVGKFYEYELNGFSHSLFEGSLHHLVAVVQDLESMHKQLNIQNRVVFKVKDFDMNAFDSLRQTRALKDSIQKIGALRCTDGFTTDADNDVMLLNSEVDFTGIIDKAVLEFMSFIWGMSLTDLTGKSENRYINTESAENQKKTIETTQNVLINNYNVFIKKIILKLLQNANLDNGIKETDFILSYD